MTGKGLFVVFEGGEGTGKSTQIRLLEEKLKSAGRDVHVTWEPGGTELGQRIRQMLMDPAVKDMDDRCEALLFAAARAQHVSAVIRPLLAKGCVVLCDRYWDASKAYQGVARGLGVEKINELNEWATQDLHPDRVVIFDMDPVKGLARAKERATSQDTEVDRLEQEKLAFHQQVRQAYLDFAASDEQRYSVVNADQSKEAIADELWQAMNTWLEK